ncbi:MAG: type VI secretion system contractile sheath large subunit [Desulfobacterales bacterium]|nr:type VI secretion system contractile sheath large subunit [Desulfobacterales bacterium]
MAEELEKNQPVQEQTVEQSSLLEEITQLTKLQPDEEPYSMAKQGVEYLLKELVKPDKAVDKVTKAVVDEMIADIDKKLSLQIDAILHNPDVQKLESAWRGLKFLIDKTNFRENIKVEILNVSKEDLIDDFEDSPEVPQSGLYKLVYSKEYGQFGGEPYAAMIGNYDFGYGPQDVQLLQNTASVAAMAHAPFIAAAAPSMFGIESFNELPNKKDLQSDFEGAQYVKWNSFREIEDSRYVGLTVPRFLLRLPYGAETKPVKVFNYEENVSASHENYLWGNTAFAFATRMTDSFAKYRWMANIIGPQGGGAVEDLPMHQFKAMGEIQTKIPTEALISDRKEFELAEQGFMALTMRKGSDNAAFFSANSAQKPKFYGISKEGKEAETNYKLGTQMPYMFVINRLAHYIKHIQRENIGTWKERGDLEKELNTWIRQYVNDTDTPTPGSRSRRPLRQAQVEVESIEGEPGWYKVGLKVRPHFKYMGAFFTLSLVGKLDKD